MHAHIVEAGFISHLLHSPLAYMALTIFMITACHLCWCMSQASYSYPAQVSVIVFMKHRLSCIMILVEWNPTGGSGDVGNTSERSTKEPAN